jgi:hypothetical protein
VAIDDARSKKVSGMNQNGSSSLSIEYEEIRPYRKDVPALVPGMNQNVSSSLSIEYEEIRPSRKDVLALVPGMNQNVSSSLSIEYEDIKPPNNAAYNQSDSSLIEIIWERPAN